ncbi:ATP-grasp domain-containing protein [Jonesia denitrificans]|uniref:ATP-grasp domain-containing protein n=1 Tax=Jonesia denitrificans (strain ATCC 14870 / DSM 20603 / BCRC 15368 / CIP 55.134 / JCM 11481 / NBRC 15587 / NCTC 10816 / Prevot 55134) TaxID=471856 RepID=C7R2U3_JONDD|nr:hypothetical protein [Jonesia denitrificans]ACV08565.1 conserved hypothetical protein [Jonesia denitrificans DSM 20603]ASE07810.1 hypothetical protein CEP80_00625 [Jonesia denitrificans]QXB42419.1 hypothetical protein I6L70_07495 [Jonesia denitrificans]SQH20550.1 Uncharacterised protein [Jonesia denitrificans]
MTNRRVALVTCSDLPDLAPDDQHLVGALAQESIDAVPAVWDDPAVAWDEFDLVVVRSTRDYAARRDEFVSWAKSVPRLLNHADVVEWNIDKYYLKEMEERGIPVVRTLWLDPARHFTSQAIHTRLPAFGDYVIKPTISAGAKDTARYQEATAQARGEAIMHVRDLLLSGRHVMIQPYLKQIDEKGETSLIFIDGQFSHAARKNPMLARGDAPASQYQVEVTVGDGAEPEYVELARKALHAAHEITGDEERFLYARVDLIPSDTGEPVLLEIELTEPTLFFAENEEAAQRFAQAVASRLDS